MEVWVWLLVYLVGFALLQLVLYRYFRERGSGEQPAGSPNNHGLGVDAGRDPRVDSATEQAADHGGDAGRSQDDPDGIRCTQCGARNERDPAFTYCQQCARPLQ
jgi:hypothetical protein